MFFGILSLISGCACSANFASFVTDVGTSSGYPVWSHWSFDQQLTPSLLPDRGPAQRNATALYSVEGLLSYPWETDLTVPGRVLDDVNSAAVLVDGGALFNDGTIDVGATAPYAVGDPPPLAEFTVSAFVQVDADETNFASLDIGLVSSLRLVADMGVSQFIDANENASYWSLFVREHPNNASYVLPGCVIGSRRPDPAFETVVQSVSVVVTADPADPKSYLEAGVWHHLACSNSASDRTFRLYVNGEVYNVDSYDDVEAVASVGAAQKAVDVDDAIPFLTFMDSTFYVVDSEVLDLHLDEVVIFSGAVDSSDLTSMEAVATNLAPVVDEGALATATGSVSFAEGTTARVVLPVTDDRQTATALTYSVTPDTAVVTDASLNFFVPYSAVEQPANSTQATFAVTVTDSDGASITFDVELTLDDTNRAPRVLFDDVATYPFPLLCGETETVTVTVTGDDPDAEDGDLTIEPLFTLDSPDVAFNETTGLFSYTPSRGTVTSGTGFQFVDFAFSAVDSLGLASEAGATKVIRVNVTAYPTPAPTPAPTAYVQPTPAPPTPVPATPAPETPAPQGSLGPASQGTDNEGLDTQSLIIIIAVSAAACIMLSIGLGYFFSSRGKSSNGGASTEMASQGSTGGGGVPSKRLKVEWLESDEDE